MSGPVVTGAQTIDVDLGRSVSLPVTQRDHKKSFYTIYHTNYHKIKIITESADPKLFEKFAYAGWGRPKED